MSRSKGFSILELVIVMAILAIGASIGSFAWNRYNDNTNLRAAARDIESDLKLMKERARSDSSQSYSMVFNLDTNSYTMTGTAGTKSPAAFSAGVKITNVTGAVAGTRTIACLPRGTYNPSSGSLILTNNRGSRATITFNVTGRTYVAFSLQ